MDVVHNFLFAGWLLVLAGVAVGALVDRGCLEAVGSGTPTTAVQCLQSEDHIDEQCNADDIILQMQPQFFYRECDMILDRLFR